MSKAILIFTFSPIQPFIGEARRASDLYVGSQILVSLSASVAGVLSEHGELIYPTSINRDVPNRIVAKVDWDTVTDIANHARDKLFETWSGIVEESKRKFLEISPPPDPLWEKIWDGQVKNENIWEIFWAAASLEKQTYKDAYDQADQALSAVKRERPFAQKEEFGEKDSLSGKRQALTLKDMPARAYWKAVGKKTTAAKLQPDGRERLDAIGVIKRFSPIAQRELAPYIGFPSTSSIAVEAFVHHALEHIGPYNQAVSQLGVFKVRKESPWLFDGDFLFPETLSARALEKDYQISKPHESKLKTAKVELGKLLNVPGNPFSRSAYYAIVALDGDDMGKRISSLLNKPTPEEEHKQFSSKISEFSGQVPVIAGKHYCAVVYNGGDDVLALAPLQTAFTFARELAEKFKEITKGSASAGIAVVHHRYPLSAALRAARDAEGVAKKVDQKDAVSLKILKRSGAPLTLTARWEDVGPGFGKLVDLFEEDMVSNRFAYQVVNLATTLYAADDLFESQLRRTLLRQRNKKNLPDREIGVWVADLMNMAQKLPLQARDLGGWLIFANFVSQGGSE